MHTDAATTEGASTMIDPAITLLDATERLERADAGLRAARAWAATTVPGATLRERVADKRRIDAAQDGLDAAQAAFDAAQDVDCPGAA